MRVVAGSCLSSCIKSPKRSWYCCRVIQSKPKTTGRTRNCSARIGPSKVRSDRKLKEAGKHRLRSCPIAKLIKGPGVASMHPSNPIAKTWPFGLRPIQRRIEARAILRAVAQRLSCKLQPNSPVKSWTCHNEVAHSERVQILTPLPSTIEDRKPIREIKFSQGTTKHTSKAVQVTRFRNARWVLEKASWVVESFTICDRFVLEILGRIAPRDNANPVAIEMPQANRIGRLLNLPNWTC